MAASPPKITDLGSKDPLDALLARLMSSAPEGKGNMGDDNKASAKTSKPGPTWEDNHTEEHDPWKALSDQVRGNV